MNYQETIDYLFNSTPVFEKIGAKAYKPGLQTTLALDDHFGHPHQQYKTIHIAGTNGKGSCSHTIAAILQSQGYKVGLYTSPHLVDFRERIRINGECIPEQYVIDFVEENRAFFEPLHPSFFELTTAMAFKYFAEKKVDYAVIEVGLGGRLDCTNIITPILSIITNISFDHTQFLGNTLPEIAREKAGIIKRAVPVIVGEKNKETWPVFEEVAKEKDAPIKLADNLYFDCVNGKSEIIEKDRKYYSRYLLKSQQTIMYQLPGSYQKKNLNTILAASYFLCGNESIERISKNTTTDGRQDESNDKATIIPPIINQEAIRYGLEHVCDLTGLRGRWEVLSEKPYTVCDTGHNLAGWEYLSKQILDESTKRPRTHIIFGMVDDKDVRHVLELLAKASHNTLFYWTQPSTKRAIPVEKVKQIAANKGLNGKAYHSVKEAYNAAKSEAKPDDFIFIGGSSYVVADLLS